ncbi:MAG: hypothetical protein JXX14_17360 [Deltaproteobacteria bacterium]|nr:hypothetical protein [Deltaproteobacteria bacterium]
MMMKKQINVSIFATSIFAALFLMCVTGHAQFTPADFFKDSSGCQGCHNGISDKSGDASFGVHWRASVMANASNDPYWRASVRRETIDHPKAATAIEDKCATCHMPMTRFSQKQNGQSGQVFAHLPDSEGRVTGADALFAKDGVSCSVCHQIQDKSLGEESSFTGGFQIDVTKPAGDRAVYGPFEVEKGVRSVMNSASGYSPQKSEHIQKSELCATCHTLYTHALDDAGRETAVLAEQVPFLEWQHSDYADAASCQDCHMVLADGPMAISSVLGSPRENVQKHVFRGGNAFLLSMLGAFSDELFLNTSATELQRTRTATIEQLQQNAATLELSVRPLTEGDTQISALVTVINNTGHKLPTAYPSRRVWIQLTVKDDHQAIVFESGRFYDGKIRGNDNDRNARRFEPHYDVITSSEQVQIYEAILGDSQNRVTTGLLQATDYLKDNRIVPAGFDKETAHSDIAVKGAARDDISFGDGLDKVAYEVPLPPAQGTYTVTANLWYQPIGYRWAVNLNATEAREAADFLRMYRRMDKNQTVVKLAETTVKTTVLPSLTITDADRAAAKQAAALQAETENLD